MSQRAVLLEDAGKLGDLRLLLANRDVDALHTAVALVDDHVGRDDGLTGLAVAQDELALAAADRGHRVDRLDARLERRIDVLALDDAGRDALDLAGLLGLDRALAVDRLTEGVDHASEQRIANRDRRDGARGADLVAFFNVGVVAHHDDGDCVFFEVEDEPVRAVLGELNELRLHGLAEAVHRGNTVTDRDHLTDVGNGCLF